MYKGRIITDTAVAVDTNIPFVTVWNTNNNTRYNGTTNAVEFASAGYYDVAVNLNVTGVATSPVAIQLFADEQPVLEAIAESDITATTGIQTLTIVDTIKVDPSSFNEFASLSVRSSDAITVLAGVFTVEKVR